MTVTRASPLLDRVIARLYAEPRSAEPRCRPTESYRAELRDPAGVVAMEQVFYTNQPLPLLAGLAGRWRFGDGETRLIAVVRAVDVGIKRVQLLDGGAFVDEADVVDGVAVLVGPALVPSAPSADPSLTIVGLDDSRAPATIPVDSNASLPSGCTPT